MEAAPYFAGQAGVAGMASHADMEDATAMTGAGIRLSATNLHLVWEDEFNAYR